MPIPPRATTGALLLLMGSQFLLVRAIASSIAAG
jgi:hypothetical protein